MIDNLYSDIVDFHAHVLSGADHGTASSSESAVQFKFAKNAGVTRIFAMPHFYPHRHSVDNFLLRRESSYKLLDASGVLADAPQIRLGAEVLLCENIHKLERLSDLCIYGTNIMLIELPFSDISNNHIKTVLEIMKMGIDVILAHADRYNVVDVERFISIGAKLQLNTSAFFPVFRKKTHIFDWLQRGDVVALGSDIHNKDRLAYRRFIKAQRLIGESLEYVRNKSDEIWENSKIFPL